MKKPRRPKPVFDLPSPAEANAAAAELSDAPASAPKPSPPKKKKPVARKKKPAAPSQKKVAEAEPRQLPVKNPIGRPRSNHGRKSTSVMVKPEVWKRLKLLALQRDIDLSEMLEDIFLTFLKNEENGK